MPTKLIYNAKTKEKTVAEYTPPVLTAEQIAAKQAAAQKRIQDTLTTALENHYDSVAKRKQYDNRLTCALRAGYAGPFQSEGVTFGIWMDSCNAYAYGVMAAVLGGQRTIPTAAELITELPSAPW